MNNKEIFWIDFYKCTNRRFGYNISIGGNSHCTRNIKEIVKYLKEGYNFSDISRKLNYDRASLYDRVRNYLGKDVYNRIIKKEMSNRSKGSNNYKYRKDIVIDDILNKLDYTRTLTQIANELNCTKSLIISRLKKYFGINKYKQMVKKLPHNYNITREIRERMRRSRCGEKGSNAKTFIFYTPKNIKYIVTGRLEKFCEENKLYMKTIYKILKGKLENNYKEWKIYSLEENSPVFYYADFT